MILDHLGEERIKKSIEVLNRLLEEKHAEFRDLTFPTIEECINYHVDFKNLTQEDANHWVKSRNFCDLSLILELERLDLVELKEDSFTRIIYRLTANCKKFIRDFKLKDILE